MRRAIALLFALAACTDDVQVGQPLRRVLDVTPDPPAAVDVLFVIDPAADADTTSARAALIGAAGDALFGELERRLGALPDLHVGVISTEVAHAGLPAGCDGGHVGALRSGDGCTNNGGLFLADAPAGAQRLTNFSGSLGDAFACLADLPPSTCAVAQPIAATRAALGAGAPGVNRDFLRDYAMLLIVYVTTRDDCSSDLPSFYSAGEFGSKPLDSRCFAEGARCAAGVCAPIDDGPLVSATALAGELRALKRDPSMVMVAGVFAPPTSAGSIDRGGGDLVPISPCGGRAAFPGVRLASLFGEFPSRYAYASICDGGAAEQLRAIAANVARVLGRTPCVLGPMPPRVPCRAFAETDAARRAIPSCDDAPGGACFRVAPADACADTASGLAATATEPLGDAHFIVECAAPPGL